MKRHLHALDGYRPASSPIHTLDARVKLVATMAFIVATALTPDGAWLPYVLLAGLAFSVILISQVSAKLIQQRTLLVLPFALTAITVAFTLPGQPMVTIPFFRWQLTITDAGLIRFASILIKAWLSVQMAAVLTASTRFTALLQAMRSLRLPKVMVAILGFTYRYLFVIADEALRLLRARSARSGTLGGRGGGSILWRARVTGGMAGSLFLRSIDRSERIYDAMVARGYDGEVRSLGFPTLRPRDVGIVLPFLLALLTIQVLARISR